jgi:hypothetical protein
MLGITIITMRSCSGMSGLTAIINAVASPAISASATSGCSWAIFLSQAAAVCDRPGERE